MDISRYWFFKAWDVQKKMIDKQKPKQKVLVLFSGGLDSRLVVKILQEQGLEVECLYFKLPFGCGCCNAIDCNFNFSQISGVKLNVIDCTGGELFKENLEFIKKAEHGRGSGINPCIDCKIFMFKKAKEYADANGFRVIATGEVLGERPMSQTKNAMATIDKELGFEILRPLSALLLEETWAEKQGLVDRKKLFGISGRKRDRQIALANRFRIKYPNPSGGCMLCDEVLSKRTKFLIDKDLINEDTLPFVNVGRHFFKNGWIILGRREAENLVLANANEKAKFNIIIPGNNPGPTCVYADKRDRVLAEELVEAYSHGDLEKRKRFERWMV